MKEHQVLEDENGGENQQKRMGEHVQKFRATTQTN